MERLTEETWRNLDPWECCGQDRFCGRSCHDLGGCTNGCIVPKLYASLAAYEDTGLEPCDYAVMRAAMEQAEEAKQQLSDVVSILGCSDINNLKELAQAEKDGRLVVQEHGLWETHLLPLAWKCSVCGFKNSFRAGKSTEYLNYCPNCGARMDAEDYRRKLEEAE